MIAQELEYHAPASADEAVGLLDGAGAETVVLGGGTWVVPELTYGDRAAGRVVDLRRAGLGGVRDDGDAIVVGATTTYAELLAAPASARVPLLRTLAAGITGGAQVRNAGTLGGSACYASPSSDVPAALVALGAVLRLRSAAGDRELPAAEFLTGASTTALRPDELLVELRVPAPADARHGYVKLKFGGSSWPIATGACVLRVAGGTVEAAALALGGVEGRPLALDLGDLVGRPLAEVAGEDVGARADAAVTDPYADVLADAGYRRSVAGVVARRAFAQAVTGEGS
jgi:CO/xanthine dehydrogenase FAD-binding subunit